MLVKPDARIVEAFEATGNELINKLGYAIDAVNRVLAGKGDGMSDERSYQVEKLNNDLAAAQEHLDSAMQYIAAMKRAANRFRQ